MGVFGGLLRVGSLPFVGVLAPAANMGHGALMICGFFGTVISLERAVALKQPGGTLAPLAAAAGGWAMLAGQPTLAYMWWLLACAVLLLLYGAALKPRFTLHAAVEACGAAAWGAGTLAALTNQPFSVALMGWCAFLVLTIAGERRELTQFVKLGVVARVGYAAAIAGLAGAVLLAWLDPCRASIVWWASCGALALWLMCFDLAPRHWSAPEWRGHMAQSLSLGYGWLAFAALLGLAGLLRHAGSSLPITGFEGPALHALLLGFVFAMVFGHAPIMLPALAGLRAAYVPWARLAIWVMTASVLLRVAATQQHWLTGRMLAGWGHALALLIFMAAMLTAVRRGLRTTA